MIVELVKYEPMKPAAIVTKYWSQTMTVPSDISCAAQCSKQFTVAGK